MHMLMISTVLCGVLSQVVCTISIFIEAIYFLLPTYTDNDNCIMNLISGVNCSWMSHLLIMGNFNFYGINGHHLVASDPSSS